MQQTAKSTKERTLQMVVMALMVALIFIFSRFLGITTDLVHLGFDFLPVMVVACLYGPVWAAVTYMVGDLVCAIGMPFGMINPGLTVIAGIIGLVYGFAFYNRDLSGKKLILASLLASLAVAGVIKLFGTTLCLAVMYGTPYWPTLISRIPNCIILFAAQIITIPLIYRYVVRPVSGWLDR
ncbi:MAG: folate family ECF transporter S component [Clostridia bacterium]|nr:folate family ECF transporter S component [Clostridia bacterium]